MKLRLVLLTIFVTEPIIGQYCPKECENQGILCNIRCVFSNIQSEFAKNNENNSSNGSNRDLNPSATIPSNIPSDVKAAFRSLGTQGREIASDIKETAKSISNNPGGFASSLATRINEGLNGTPTPTNLNEALTSVKEGGNVVLSTLKSGFENGFGPISTYSGNFASDFATTAGIIGSEANNFVSSLSSRFNSFEPTSTYSGNIASDFATTASIIGSEANNFASSLSSRLRSSTLTTPSGSRASPMNSIGLANILGISLISLSSIVLSSFI